MSVKAHRAWCSRRGLVSRAVADGSGATVRCNFSKLGPAADDDRVSAA
eukprot:SAG22_NODE_2489_length_2516_cov_7.268515_1_plen_47_part_10